MLPDHHISWTEFLNMDQGEDRMEFIYGEVFCLASPSEEHQRILRNLVMRFGDYFNGKECSMYFAPFDVILSKAQDTANNKVQPDLMVICDKSGLNPNNYTGVPNLIVEVVSATNSSHDYTKKFNLYMSYGVKEYWIVNPKSKSIQIFTLVAEGMYDQFALYKDKEVLYSAEFEDFSIKLEDIFA